MSTLKQLLDIAVDAEPTAPADAVERAVVAGRRHRSHRAVGVSVTAAAVAATVVTAGVLTVRPSADSAVGGAVPSVAASPSAAPASAVTTPLPQPADQPTTLCQIADTSLVIPASTGDPIADCETAWRQDDGTAPPALKAYGKPGMAVLVLPASATPAPGFTLLPRTFRQDDDLIRLTQFMQDRVSGGDSRCFDAASMNTLVEGELSALGLTGWTVQTLPANGGARATCQQFVGLDPVGHRVMLRPLPTDLLTGSADDKFVTQLRALQSHCQGLDATATAVLAAARQVGWTLPNAVRVTKIATDGATCTTIQYAQGGTVTLRGPQS